MSKNIKKAICSPTVKDKRYTCYSDKDLDTLKKLWNIRHPDVMIDETEPRMIWEKLKLYMNDVCNTEKCWLRQNFAKHDITSKISNYTFAPSAPNTWKKNPNEWLNSLDIESIMKQHEKNMKNFIFIGPSPIDFDKKLHDGECVWDELCNFNLIKLLKKGKNKIGFIFNLDPHNKDGSHWFSTFCDIKKKYIFFIDSTGDEMPSQVRKLIERITKQAKDLNIDLKLYENDKEHQLKNTECGMYSLYIIIELLYNRKTPEYFMTNRIPDKEMEELRLKYFNHDE